MSERFFDGIGALAVGAGTDALHLALLLAGLEAGNDILMSVFTYTATKYPLLYMGVKPFFVDVNPNALHIDVANARLEANEKIKAIVLWTIQACPAIWTIYMSLPVS
jgi:dTDP-4-amino-4,6-dideoxygalactose transaminase